MRRWVAGAAVAGLVAAGGGGYVLLRDDGPEVVQEDARIDVVDGPRDEERITLDATFYRPTGAGKVPAVLLAHGFGGSKRSQAAAARDLAERGYAVLTWSARGFGASGGQIALNSPDYEVKDTRQLIDWLGKRPEVLQDAPGDPRVGMAGPSYGGAISLLTAAYDDRVDALVPSITWHDLSEALLPDGVFKKLWAGLFFTGESDGSTACGRFRPELCAMYQRIAQTGEATEEDVALLRASSPSTAPPVKAPTLLIQGQSDSLFPLDHADANARRAAGPVSVVWYQGGHDGGDAEAPLLTDLTATFFDDHLKGLDSEPAAAFTVSRATGVDSTNGRTWLRAATSPTYPGLSSTPRAMPVEGDEQTVQNPAGGVPAAISALPGLGGLSALGSSLGSLGADFASPGQSASFTTEPLAESLRVTGAPRLTVKVDRAATLFAKVYDVTPEGAAALARRIAAPVRLTEAGEAEVVLPAIDYDFARGHRVRIVLSTTDQGFASPLAPATYKISAVSALTLPTVPGLATPAGRPPAWVWALPLGALVVAGALVFRRRPKNSFDPALAEVPLRIDGLTKTYSNGFKAVDDLSFKVEKGQVLGLLGPNGAGKTTTLRMLMGLIHPEGGEIRIFGHKVTPGAAVLRRLGSFVEGPGFLPHLSGRDNLTLYWRATGRPFAEAHLEEALEVADLGEEALARPVRTYSQGMRARLAIAQAMLGLPDLLVLDEPTNGLDPPQIRAMREVLVDYAARGRTVIVSSHLLSEVEQTCSHVVVMTRGAKVADGPVEEIVGGRGLENVFLEIIGGGV
ncbi:ABC-2 type transport system ATP-binding protein [Actinocorallia herbida]|uniref:ABC-2 type transport system ATP-binding protein n=1 Tax=Actinocorallia herbida TaxID=58109 RepID=A0A3N1D9T3_9ACTN|nr:alpha/beta fold hydrolase [Actinocorallia herbida]ROO90281.1 ABC-2 type transport system ATP-binding protein [Actinocorallia herbida]